MKNKKNNKQFVCKKCNGAGQVLDKNQPGFMQQISTTEINFERHYVDCDECAGK
jgi:ribosomal protein L34E